jgi:hypothetical protein
MTNNLIIKDLNEIESRRGGLMDFKFFFKLKI